MREEAYLAIAKSVDKLADAVLHYANVLDAQTSHAHASPPNGAHPTPNPYGVTQTETGPRETACPHGFGARENCPTCSDEPVTGEEQGEAPAGGFPE